MLDSFVELLVKLLSIKDELLTHNILHERGLNKNLFSTLELQEGFWHAFTNMTCGKLF